MHRREATGQKISPSTKKEEGTQSWWLKPGKKKETPTCEKAKFNLGQGVSTRNRLRQEGGNQAPTAGSGGEKKRGWTQAGQSRTKSRDQWGLQEQQSDQAKKEGNMGGNWQQENP